MASKYDANLVYDTKTGRQFHVHPKMLKDNVWLSQRGLIPVAKIPQGTTPQPQAGNSMAALEAKLKAEIEAKLRAEMAEEAAKNEAELIAKVAEPKKPTATKPKTA